MYYNEIRYVKVPCARYDSLDLYFHCGDPNVGIRCALYIKIDFFRFRYCCNINYVCCRQLCLLRINLLQYRRLQV